MAAYGQDPQTVEEDAGPLEQSVPVADEDAGLAEVLSLLDSPDEAVRAGTVSTLWDRAYDHALPIRQQDVGLHFASFFLRKLSLDVHPTAGDFWPHSHD